MTSSTRVVICGGGIIAASIAYHLSKLGVKPIIIERCAVACAASGKAGGFLARSWSDSSPARELARSSFDLHMQLADELDGAAQYAFCKAPTLQVITSRTVKQRGSDTLNRKSVAEEYPWLNGLELGGAERMDPLTATVHPGLFTNTLMNAAVANGAEVRIGTVEGVELASSPTGSKTVAGVKVDGKTIPCDQVVIATGPWTGVSCKDWLGVHIPMSGGKSNSLVYVLDHPLDQPASLFCEEDKRGCHPEIFTRPTGEVYVCGAGDSKDLGFRQLSETPPEMITPDSDRIDALHESFMGLAPDIADKKWDRAQACLRPVTPDGIPVMGKLANFTNAFVCAGHSCWGILWAPSSGRAMAELLIEGKAKSLDLSPFNPNRF